MFPDPPALVAKEPGGSGSRSNKTLRVGTTHAPPFVIKNEDGSWSGISIELWRAIAADHRLTYEFHELELPALLAGVQNGSLDAVVEALPLTAEREQMIDSTHPFYTTGLGIAVAVRRGIDWVGAVQRFFSLQIVHMVGLLVLGLLIAGLLVWLFERKHSPHQFGEQGTRGLWSGIWWAAVTMTGVGYGDKIPVTVGGRIFALFWMFVGIMIISSFTATITTALPLHHLTSPIHGPQDLTKSWVATLASSTSESYLRRNRTAYREYETLADGLWAVAAGEVEAMVYDAPLLRYLAHNEMHGAVEVLPVTFEPQSYAIALPAGSPLREPINRALLDTIEQPAWHEVLYRYLGRQVPEKSAPYCSLNAVVCTMHVKKSSSVPNS